MTLAPHQLANQDSGDFEYMTPPEIIQTARILFEKTTGRGIEMDPASSEDANKFIGADHIWTIETNGLEQSWALPDGRPANVWLNHPFGRTLSPQFMRKLLLEYNLGHIEQALNLTWANIETQWFQHLWDFPMWVPEGRLQFLDPATGKPKQRWDEKKGKFVNSGATKAAVITYLGPYVNQFAEVFTERHGGNVYVPYYTVSALTPVPPLYCPRLFFGDR